MLGSVLTVGREALSDYWQWSADDIAMADYIDDNAETDAVFLTSDSHLCPVFSLAGRRIFVRLRQLCILPRHELYR